MSNLKTKIAWFLLITTSVMAVSCHSPKAEPKTLQALDSTASDAQTASIATPEVSFTDETGKEIKLNTLKGKVLFINFWATWCGPCIREMPSIHALKESFRDNKDLLFIMVDIDGTLEKSKKFMKKNKYDLPVYIPHSPIPPNFFSNAVPTIVIINKKGELVEQMVGGRDYAAPEIKELLHKLLQSQ
ncbi:TlpA family protein disulfide reductase [Sphingobacterium kitahiroshimense]|uniref:TlpA disulfide reductase family protein n=1 Tax=Sphingobacterium kitahiroshimense TaxID=470446 RepID=A0ABV0BVV0_9SPHI